LAAAAQLPVLPPATLSKENISSLLFCVYQGFVLVGAMHQLRTNSCSKVVQQVVNGEDRWVDDTTSEKRL
jgi:hypothetical protein